MIKYPIFSNGEKAVLEDISATALAAGKADDASRASLHKVYLEGANRRGFVIPFKDGPLVVGNGSNGKVKVKPFRALISPGGATSSAGTEDASGGSETLEDVKSGFYAGGESSITVPLSGAGKTRWDLLYARVAQTDSDSANRLVKDASTGLTSVQNIYTRSGVVVSLLWVQGTEQNNTDTQYLSGNLPALPTPAAGEAHVPLALVQVRYAASMGTASYTRDHIANCAPIARVNEKTGSVVLVSGGISNKATTTTGHVRGDAKSIITLDSSEGGWPLSGSNNRPSRFSEYLAGGPSGFFKIGPLKNAAIPADSTWHIFTEPLAEIETTSGNFEEFVPFDWRDRFFVGRCFTRSNTVWADAGGAGVTDVPFFVTGQTICVNSCGHSYRENALSMGSYRPAVLFYDVATGGASGECILALVVSSSTGKLHLAAYRATATAGSFDNMSYLIHLEATDRGMSI